MSPAPVVSNRIRDTAQHNIFEGRGWMFELSSHVEQTHHDDFLLPGCGTEVKMKKTEVLGKCMM